MKNKLLLLTALALSLAGCKLMEPKPDGSSDGATLGGLAPEPLPEQVIPDRGEVPALPASTHIIVGLCPATNAYSAMGVDTKAQHFTFTVSGKEATRQQAFQRFFAAGVPVTVYTRPVKVRITASLGVSIYDPCQGLLSGQTHLPGAQGVVSGPHDTVEDPPPTPKPTGGQRDNLHAFGDLSWKTAFALDAVSEPVSAGPPIL